MEFAPLIGFTPVVQYKVPVAQPGFFMGGSKGYTIIISIGTTWKLIY